MVLNTEVRPLPKGWRWVKLGEVCEVVTGNTPPRGETHFYGGKIPWIKSEDLDKEMYVQDSTEYLSDEGAKVARLLPKGSVLVSCIGKIGKTAIAGCQLATNQQLNALIPRDEVVPEYLYFACQSIRPILEVAASQALVAILNKSDFSSVEIQLPPLPEQRRIASILKEQMGAVEKARAAAEAQLEAAKALPGAFLREVFPAPGEDLPHGWRWVKLRDMCDVQLGKMLSPKSKTGSNPQPYLRNANIQWNQIDLTDVATMDFNEREQQKFALKKGDLLVCEGGEPGRSALWDGSIEPCFYQKAVHRIRAKENMVAPAFLMFRLWLGSHRGEFLSEHAKTTIAHLPAVRLEQLPLALPSIKQQTLYSVNLQEKMASVERLKSRLERQLLEIEVLPAALLRQAFSG